MTNTKYLFSFPSEEALGRKNKMPEDGSAEEREQTIQLGEQATPLMRASRYFVGHRQTGPEATNTRGRRRAWHKQHNKQEQKRGNYERKNNKQRNQGHHESKQHKFRLPSKHILTMFSWSQTSTKRNTQYPGRRQANAVTTATALEGSIRPPSTLTRAQHLESYLQDSTLSRSTRRVSTGTFPTSGPRKTKF